MPSDPKDYQDAIIGPDASGWKKIVMEESNSIIDHDVFERVDVPQSGQLIAPTFLYRWKYDEGRTSSRNKSRVVLQGFHEADSGADNAVRVPSS